MTDEDRSWTELIIRDRMEVDREFEDRIRESEFTPQEWNRIMTAVEFRVESDGVREQLVADTSRIESVLPQLDEVNVGPHGVAGPPRRTSQDRGLLSKIATVLGIASDEADRHDEAVSLATEYAAALQERLEETGKWERVRREIDHPSPE